MVFKKCLDIMEFNKSLKIVWVLKYISDECKSKWKCFFYFHLSKLGGKSVFLENLSKKDAMKLNVKDNFLQELTGQTLTTLYRDSFDSQHDFSSSLIWNNSLVRIAGKDAFYKNWAKAGVKNIKDLMSDEYEVITYSNFKEKYCFPVSFLEFYGVASAIRSAMKTLKMKSQVKTIKGFQYKN